MTPMHIAMVGHIAGSDVRPYLQDVPSSIPAGYLGAPLMGMLVGELLRRGHQVTAITTDSSLPVSRGPVTLEHGAFRFVVCPARRRAWRPNGWRPGRAVDFFAYERGAVAEAIRGACPDVVHAHWSYEFALAAIASGYPHVVTCHDSPAKILRFTRSPYRAIRYLMARRVFATGAAFTVVSDYLKTELSGVLRSEPVIVPNPVARAAIDAGRVRERPVTRRVAMVCNGWDEWKNPRPALQAFARWRALEPAAELHAFGDGFGPTGEAAAWVQAHGLGGGVHLHGRVEHAELIERLSTMDALLHPALEESFGVAVAEAMALGLPVVAGEKSGAVPWVTGACDGGASSAATLVDVSCAEAIVAGLCTTFDDAYRGRSGSGIGRVAAHFAPATVARLYETCYAEALDRQRAVGVSGRPVQTRSPTAAEEAAKGSA